MPNLEHLNLSVLDLLEMLDGQLSASLINLPDEISVDNSYSYEDDWDDEAWEDDWEDDIEDITELLLPKFLVSVGIKNQITLSDILDKYDLEIVLDVVSIQTRHS